MGGTAITLATIMGTHSMTAHGICFRRFVERYGTDEFLCAQTWELLPQSVKDEIGFDLSLGEVPGDTK